MVTYAQLVVDYRPQKKDQHCVRITVGGNLIKYPFEFTTHTSDITTTNVMWNSSTTMPKAHPEVDDVAPLQ